MKHVIVTGGSGFIGSHLCDLLLSKGYAVTAIDNLITGRIENITEAKKNPNFRFLNWDICNPLEEKQIELLGKFGLHGLFHFACPASPVDFDRIPFVILAVDSIGTFKTVDLALKYGARYVLASTSEVYGDPLVHPQPETYWGNVNSIGPRACYDEAKRFGEACVSTARTCGIDGKYLNAAIVRIFNTYGPRMRPDDGRVVPELCMRALRDEPLTVHGDGKQTRSFCFVSDLVDGIVRLFESREFGPINIGNPGEYQVIQFAEKVREFASSSSTIEYLPARPDDPYKRRPDITRARELLKWEPKIGLEEGLRRTLDYFRGTLS